LKWGGPHCQMLQIVVTKLGQVQMVHPILLICRHIFFKELLDHRVHPLGCPSVWGWNEVLRPHALPQGSPKLACELGLPIWHNVLWEAMMLAKLWGSKVAGIPTSGSFEDLGVRQQMWIQVKNNERKNSPSTFTTSQHFEG
jgi:hypothetical protein